ncbi:MAG: chemotaxis protein [Firmicutes bacterium]|nr:chemotaxis protein [Bacillota bacterium]
MNWLNNSKMAIKLTLLISVFMISLVAVGCTGYYYLLRASNGMNSMYNAYMLPVQWLNDNRNQSRKIEAEMFDLMITKEDKQKKHIIADIDSREKLAIYKNLEAYEKIRLDDFEAETLKQTYSNLEKYRVIRQEVINLAVQDKKSEAYELYTKEARPVFDKLSVNLRDLTDYREEAADGINKQNKNDFEKAILWFISIIIIAVIAGIAVGWIITRSITRPLSDAVDFIGELASGDFSKKVSTRNMSLDNEFGRLAQAVDKMNKNISGLIKQISHTSEQVAASSEQLTASAEQSAQASNQVAISVTKVARGADNQLRLVHSTTEVIKQMSNGINQVAENATVVSASAERTAKAANDGEHAVEKAVKQMVIIEQKTNATSNTIGELEEKSKQIGQIVEAISSISGQTNLLALNAAIEAARAGEAGRGFAVVADEVRKLAEQSQKATQQIADLIGEVQEKTIDAVVFMNDGKKEVNIGTEVVSLAGKSFREIIMMIREISNQIHEISAAIQQITNSSQHMVGAIQEVDRESKSTAEQTQTVSAATEEQSASIEEIASSSQYLAKMAENLQTAINKFKI